MTQTHSRRTILIFGLAVTVVTLASSFASESQRPGRQRRALAPAQQIPDDPSTLIPLPSPEPEPLPGHLGFRVKTNPNLPSKAIQQTVAMRLQTANPLIFARLTRFKYLDAPNFRLDGWEGRIEGLSPTPDGCVVTIRVLPIVTSTFGASTTMLDWVFEKYEFANGTFRYLGMMDDPKLGESRGSFITD